MPAQLPYWCARVGGAVLTDCDGCCQAGCCRNPPDTVTANGGPIVGIPMPTTVPGNWGSDWFIPDAPADCYNADPSKGPLGWRIVMGCTGDVWTAAIEGWAGISANNGTLVSAVCDPFRVVFSFPALGPADCDGFSVTFSA